jgi:MFS family permease
MGSAPANRRGIAAGVMATARNTGMLFGIAIAGAVLTTLEVLHRPLLSALSTSFSIGAVIAAVGAFFTMVGEKKEIISSSEIKN